MTNDFKYIFLVCFLCFFIIMICYMMYAKMSKPQKWPFVTHKSKKDVYVTQKGLVTLSYIEPATKTKSAISILFTIIALIFLAAFFAIAYIGMKMTIIRYKLIGEAMKSGNTGIAGGLMLPEVGAGINYLLR